MSQFSLKSRETVIREVKDNRDKTSVDSKKLESIVKDAKVISDTSKRLRNGSTLEGVRDVQNAFRNSQAVALEHYRHQDSALEKRLSESVNLENDLRHRTESASHDARQSADAAGRIDQTTAAKQYMADAGQASAKDAYFTDEQLKNARDTRQRGVIKKEQLAQQIHNALLYTVSLDSVSAGSARIKASDEQQDHSLYGFDISKNPYQGQLSDMEKKDKMQRLWQDKQDKLRQTEEMKKLDLLRKPRVDLPEHHGQSGGYVRNNPGYEIDKDNYKRK
jgi:hypothetical protein